MRADLPELLGLSKADYSYIFSNVGRYAGIAGIVRSRLFQQFRQSWHVCRNCWDCRKPTIPAYTADIESAGIVEALPKMPGLSKIFIFWICMNKLKILWPGILSFNPALNILILSLILAQKSNLIHLSRPKSNFIILSRKSVTP